jgi:hypothetical protein
MVGNVAYMEEIKNIYIQVSPVRKLEERGNMEHPVVKLEDNIKLNQRKKLEVVD